MNVAYFGTGARRLFGIYEPPPHEVATSHGIVLCPAWGSEYLMSHRSLRMLALSLAARGLHVLRFDYFGTGDSAGNMADVTLAGCEHDIASAIDELREISNAREISLLGLRMGADLVARVGARRTTDFRHIVLWDPIGSGSQYLAELTQRDSSKIDRGADLSRSANWMRFVTSWGFRLTDAFRAELGAMELSRIADALPPQTVIATSSHRSEIDAVKQHLESAGSPVQFEHIDSPSAWSEMGNLGAAAVPVALLQSIVARLAA